MQVYLLTYQNFDKPGVDITFAIYANYNDAELDAKRLRDLGKREIVILPRTVLFTTMLHR